MLDIGLHEGRVKRSTYEFRCRSSVSAKWLTKKSHTKTLAPFNAEGDDGAEYVVAMLLTAKDIVIGFTFPIDSDSNRKFFGFLALVGRLLVGQGLKMQVDK